MPIERIQGRLALGTGGRTMQIPETRYARAGDTRIAFQQWREGSRLIIIPAFISNLGQSSP
jgi:hypothetical protein